MVNPLSKEALTNALNDLPGWSGDTSGLKRLWHFADFRTAITFMHEAAPAIDSANHHPEWTNVYNRVSVTLSTHDAGNCVTELDVKLALLLDAQARHHGGR
jgi:4a-hydroxytetrahydrobiopterin dehydratase